MRTIITVPGAGRPIEDNDTKRVWRRRRMFVGKEPELRSALYIADETTWRER
jgi:hypothetical protein